MTAKSVLLRPQGLRPKARAPCYATEYGHNKILENSFYTYVSFCKAC